MRDSVLKDNVQNVSHQLQKSVVGDPTNPMYTKFKTKFKDFMWGTLYLEALSKLPHQLICCSEVLND